MLEEQDIKKLKELLATKEDLKSFATKEDLKLLATKEDLKLLATKEDLKQEIEGLGTMMKNSFDYVETRFDRIENILLKQQGERIESLERRLSKLEDALTLAMK